jgi:hypothetical protein
MRIRFNKRRLTFLATVMFVLVGTYNAVVINSESQISADEIRFVKRLDEVYGVVTPGRMVAASTAWKKLAPSEMKSTDNVVQVVSKVQAAPVKDSAPSPDGPVGAAIQEELNLNLAEVVNAKLWPQGLASGGFSGHLMANDGIIENLNVSLPNGRGLSVSFTEMSGNVFEYDLEGEIYSGMFYQVDQSAFMVTLSNGPLEGTRLRFARNSEGQEEFQVPLNEVPQQEIQQELQQDHNIQTGNFGGAEQTLQNPETISDYDKSLQGQGLAAQGVDLEQSQAL